MSSAAHKDFVTNSACITMYLFTLVISNIIFKHRHKKTDQYNCMYN